MYNIGKKARGKNMSLQDKNSDNINKTIINITNDIKEKLDYIEKNIGYNEKIQNAYNKISNKQVYYNNKTKKYFINENNNEKDITDIICLIDLCVELSDIAYKDELTQIYNRRKMKQITNEIFKNNQSDNIFIAIIDLDNFKKINDKYGHPEGDKILKKLVEIIKKSLKEQDMVFRYGGEEFTIIFKNKNKDEVLKSLNKVQININDTLFPNDIRCSVSIGYAKKDETYERTIRKADEALYEVKTHGKNGICYQDESYITRPQRQHIKILTRGKYN